MEFLECRSHRYPGKVQPSSRDMLTGVRGCSWGYEQMSAFVGSADRTKVIQERKLEFLPNTTAKNSCLFVLGGKDGGGGRE